MSTTGPITALLAALLLLLSAAAPLHGATLVQKGSRWVEFSQADPPKADGAPAPGAAADRPPAAELRAQVVAVKNSVQIRQGDDQRWIQAKVGDLVTQGAEIRTGLRSAVQIRIGKDHIITIDRLGVVKFLNLIRDQGVIKTDVGMEYGRTRYDIATGGATHDAKIHTPGTTLAIRGTSTGTQSDAFTDATWVIRGVVDNTNKLRREMVRIDASTGKATVTSDLITPAAFARNKTRNDSKGRFAGRSATDDMVVEQFTSGVLDDREGGIDEAQQLARLEGFQFAGAGVFGDVFDLDLLWFSGGDLDLIITDPLGGVLDPKGQTVVRSGQSTQGQFTTSPVDDDGTNGFESAQFGPQIPVGNFMVTVRYISGDDAFGFLDARLLSTDGVFGSESFDVSPSTPEAKFLVDPQNQTVTPVGGGGGI